MLEQHPVLTLIPPLLALTLVIITKRVVISLGAGAVAAAFLIAELNPLHAVSTLWNAFAGIFWDFSSQTPNWYNLLILVFLLVLGVITALVMMSGGTKAFAEWILTRIKTRKGAGALTAGLGMAIFIDDYFNSLAVGQIARPVTDRMRISRAKLAYLIDSSSAPVTVLVPFSSWGASIIGIIAPLIAVTSLEISEAGAFMVAAGMNYYAIAALLILWITVMWGLDFGSMRTEEQRAISDNQPFEPTAKLPAQLSDNVPQLEKGKQSSLIVPFIALVGGVIGGIFYTGYLAGGSLDPMEMLANTDVPLALNIGGLLGLLTALFYYLRHTAGNPTYDLKVLLRGIRGGAGSMLPAVLILIFAWLLGSLIGELGTGAYIGELVAAANISAAWLVPLLFTVAGVMAFATGTSWGAFGILLPLAGEIITAVPDGENVLLVAFGAVLAGAVFGDHCSPISDTTILSATGASCNLITHVKTQLPYAMLGALAALFGYVVFALTLNGFLGALSMFTAVMFLTAAVYKIWPPLKNTAAQEVV